MSLPDGAGTLPVSGAPGRWSPRAASLLDACRERGLTLEQVGQREGITKERVRQIEARAMDKMTKFVLAAAGKPLLPKAAAA